MLKIPSTLYWPDKYKNNVDEYSLSELRKKLIIDKSWYFNKKDELEKSTNWKFPKINDDIKQTKILREINAQKEEIIRKQLQWEKDFSQAFIIRKLFIQSLKLILITSLLSITFIKCNISFIYES